MEHRTMVRFPQQLVKPQRPQRGFGFAVLNQQNRFPDG
jgi:hypothetical protein